MRICHLAYDDLGNPWLGGGGALRAWEIYRRLAARHQITMVSGGYPGAVRDEVVEGVRVIRLGAERCYACSRIGYMRKAPAVLRRLAWDLWVYEFSAFAPLVVPRRVRRLGVLQLYHLVGMHAFRKHPLVGLIAWLAERRVVRAYPYIVTISPSVQRAIRARAAVDTPVDCVATGVDDRYLRLEPADEPFVLYLGRIDIHTKGLDLLVSAFAQVAARRPDVELAIAGRGREREAARLRRLVAASPARARIRVIGPVGEAEKCELLRRCRVFCMPSRYEGWGIAAIEAAAAGKPVVGTAVSGLCDAVMDEQTGLLVAPEQPAALAAGLERLLADQDERTRLGRNARRWAQRFSWDRIAEEQLTAYERALARREAPASAMRA